ncbi:MAG TPA: 16S rRNA (adenine(1518)-N(6)/adenine(1519)-N(6))-dimethyltransferase RsmA [Flavobacteriales bacterium]|nr:16S rRNA (adenine(1518)-N(6)/adenine(1519)-N(6))-dimethyltransferase RsmA [Flavobacteriales bacterium]
MNVRPKKHLGQHFLHDQKICERIAAAVSQDSIKNILEIGPGTGALTKKLLPHFPSLKVIDIDTESIRYLRDNNVLPAENSIEGDFLENDISSYFNGEQFMVVGNFPYNISSQILFKVYDNKTLIPEMVGMFQKEVAVRITSGHGTKDYGILSVLIQAFYEAKYLFTVNQGSFNPPPKVKSGVIKLVRKNGFLLGYDEKIFSRVVKAAFNQRRKTLKNSLSGLMQPGQKIPFEGLRPEQLSVPEFIELGACFR